MVLMKEIELIALQFHTNWVYLLNQINIKGCELKNYIAGGTHINTAPGYSKHSAYQTINLGSGSNITQLSIK